MSAAARAARRLWRSPGPLAGAARAGLLPLSALYRAGTAARNAAYDAGLLRTSRLPLPAVGIGNLAVGGTGKTPFAIWTARSIQAAGLRPGILLRDYGGDEAAELAASVRGAVVEAGADRIRAAGSAAARGAEVLVLDDCLQRRDVAPDLMLVLVAAETWASRHWPLPAGPWREGPGALSRGDAVVVTYKTAEPGLAASLAASLAARSRSGAGVAAGLAPGSFRPLRGGAGRGPETLAGRQVVALCGIGEPEPFAAQLEALGARVRLLDLGDHHAYRPRDVEAARRLAGKDALIVTTAKDAVKLERLWPADGPECLVSELRVTITAGAAALAVLLDRVVAAARAGNPELAASSPSRER